MVELVFIIIRFLINLAMFILTFTIGLPIIVMLIISDSKSLGDFKKEFSEMWKYGLKKIAPSN